MNDSIDGREFLGSYRFDDDSGKLVAIGSATLYRERGRDWIWFKHGPLFTSVPNTETVQNMCSALKKLFTKLPDANPIFIRLNSSTKASSLLLPFEHTMYDETVVVELDKSEEDMFVGMSQSGRQGIRRAAKASVNVREITDKPSDFFENRCYPILKETGLRDGFGIHPLTVYKNFLDKLGSVARLYVAEVNGVVEAWAITTEFNTQAMYYYGGSSAKARETYAAYALHWEIMRVMKQRGNRTYDFMGIAGKHYTGLKNVTQFKIKFSKNIVTIPTTYDLPLQPYKYRLLAVAVKLKRSLSK